MHLYVHSSAIYNSQDDVWYYMCVCVCVCVFVYTTEYYSAIKKKEIMPFAATWMNPEIIILSKIRTRQILCDITYMWNLKYNTNEHIYETETDSQS